MWRSPGAEPAREGRALALALLLLCPAAARAETGQEAFARQDYAAAAELWRAEAAEGSAEAKFGLGLIHDLGLGVPRSSAATLRWYLEAAGDGLADAQFNVAVMFDAGTGMARDPAAAAAWYARAAANGHARAQYNLGMLYQNGTGVPQNDDLARTWYERASPALAAAADRLAQLPPPEAPRRGGPSPQPVTGAVVGPPESLRAELVWTAEPGGTEFRVQIARRPGGAGPDASRDASKDASGDATGERPGRNDILVVQDVEGSAAALDLPVGATELLWRVGRMNRAGEDFAWSPWGNLRREQAPEDPGPLTAAAEPGQGSGQAPGLAPPSERLTILVNAGDDLARAFAEELSASFAQGGVDVTVQDAARPAEVTTVEYRHPGDAAFAASIAGFLPALQPGSLVRAPDADSDAATDARPGEVTLRLVGGPRPAGPPEG